MADSFWKRLGPGGGGDLQASIDRLTNAVNELTTAHRKQAEQLKNLREAQKDSEARWREAIDQWQKLAKDTQLKELRESAKAQERLQKQWQSVSASVEEVHKTERKWRVIFSRQIDALIRHLLLGRVPLPQPYDITARRFRLRSQNEEDGVILALLERTGWTNCRFVEIGSGRSGGNAAFLAAECGWSGLMIDIEPAAIDGVRERFGHNPGVVGVVAAVSPDNVNTLLTGHGFGGEVDLLSIDIDSYDYWVLDALTACSPRLLALEYNAGFGAERAVTVPLNQPLAGAPKGYHGASLAALEKLARKKGYRLVACEPSGVNAFFLRHDVAPEIKGLPVARAFRPALSRIELGDVPIERDVLALAGPAFPLVDV